MLFVGGEILLPQNCIFANEAIMKLTSSLLAICLSFFILCFDLLVIMVIGHIES